MQTPYGDRRTDKSGVQKRRCQCNAGPTIAERVSPHFRPQNLMTLSATLAFPALKRGRVPVTEPTMSSDMSEDSGGAVRSRTVCALCRQRKTKCDRSLPRCGFCIKAKAECQYLPKPRKRGLRAGYVAELEARIGGLCKTLSKFSADTGLASLEGHVETLNQTVTVLHVQQSTPTNSVNPTVQDIAATAGTQLTPERGPPVLNRANIPRNASSTASAAATDLACLPRAFFHSLAEFWFNENHHWLPILDRNHVQSSLDALPDPVDSIPDVVLRAVIALRIAYASQAICLGYEGRRRLSLFLRSQVLIEAMATPSLKSAQALQIIALLDYGSDEIPSTFGIMAMVRRMAETIGLFKQLLARIETQSPTQVVPTAREVSMGDSASIALAWAIVSFDPVSGLGVSWRDASDALIDHMSSIAYVNVPDFRDSFRTHIHLAAIGVQPVHEFITAYAKGEHQILEDQALRVADDLYNSMISYKQGLPTSGYTTLADGDIDFDINHVFTRLLTNATIILVYQRYLLDDNGEVALARERCMQSYTEIIDVIRNLSDTDIEVNTPTFSHFLSVGARMKIVMTRMLGQPYDPQLDTIMHGINMCARRWPLARRLDYTLTTAIMQATTGAPTSLPEEFWNLKKSHIDISESMKAWLHKTLPTIESRSLMLPYV